MVSCLFLTGEAGKIIDHNTRYVMVTRPVMDYGTRTYIVDSYPVKVKNPPGSSIQIMKVPEGTLVTVKGRIEADVEANKILEAHGLPGTCLVIIAEITECYTLSSGMGGYQQFFPVAEK